MSNTYKHYPQSNRIRDYLRYPHHKQQLAEYYYARKTRLPKVRLQSDVIREGAWSDQWISTADYSERKRQGLSKVRRLKKRRIIKKNHQKYV